jgi:hypothetical protein
MYNVLMYVLRACNGASVSEFHSVLICYVPAQQRIQNKTVGEAELYVARIQIRIFTAQYSLH